MLRMSGRLLLRWKRGPPPAAGPPDGDDEDEEEQDADADGGWLPAACPPIMATRRRSRSSWVGLLGSLLWRSTFYDIGVSASSLAPVNFISFPPPSLSPPGRLCS
jgi:hypothetical protein